MDPERQFILAIVGMVAGTGITIFLISTIVGFIKFLISNRKGGSNANQVSRQEFDEMKGRLERRIQTIEAIVIDEEPRKIRDAYDEEKPEPLAGSLRNTLKSR